VDPAPSCPSTEFIEFDPPLDDLPPEFELLWPGAVGGKTRGLLFAAVRLAAGAALAGEHTHRLKIPPSAIVGTDLFDLVIEENGLMEAMEEEDGEATYAAFLQARFPDPVVEIFRGYLERNVTPLAIRSSSLHEDNSLYSFSGIHRTHFVANSGDLERRLRSFLDAVRVVLGSTFLERAAAYRRDHGLSWRDEKMGLLVQHLVGHRRGDFWYPLVGGVGFSRNMYPWSPRLRAEDGVVRLVYGLGTRAVDRDFARVFVPTFPRLRPEGFAVEAIEQYAQERFDAVDLESGRFRRGLHLRDIVSVEHNDLHMVASLIREGEFLQPARFPLEVHDRFVVTFDEVISGRTQMPLVSLVRNLFEHLEGELCSPVDIEFAVTAMDGSGTPSEFHLLQVRPLGVRPAHRPVQIEVGDGRVLLRSTRVMGNNEIRGIRHLVLVSASEYRRTTHSATVREIDRLNRELFGTPYLLVGPGRWGSTNPTLGVPTPYNSISGAVAIIEVAAGEMCPEVSYGTHFFGDLQSKGTIYLGVLPDDGDIYDEEFLLGHSVSSRDAVHLVELPEPMVVQVDGRSREGVVWAPR
jgi:hypothetical protein